LSGAGAYRLPTESEWEYAARAGSQSAFFWGEQSQCAFANGADAALKKDGLLGDNWQYAECNDGFAYTASVDSFKANAWELYDMSGNVWEWVQDCWHDNYENAPTDGSAWLDKDKDECTMRSVRGGGWGSSPAFLRSANRSRISADEADNGAGFRLARTP
jgi:formylglycine-generating enzyme required for sulfatase activity